MKNHFLPVKNIYTCTIKSREEMERDLSREQLGWWHDCIHGQTVELRQATKEDLGRSWLRSGVSRNPEDYMIQNFQNGSLVHKGAIKMFKEKAI